MGRPPSGCLKESYHYKLFGLLIKKTCNHEVPDSISTKVFGHRRICWFIRHIYQTKLMAYSILLPHKTHKTLWIGAYTLHINRKISVRINSFTSAKKPGNSHPSTVMCNNVFCSTHLMDKCVTFSCFLHKFNVRTANELLV